VAGNRVKGILLLSVLLILLVTCGCSTQSPAVVHADTVAMGERINASQGYYDGLVQADPDNSTAWLIRGMYYNNAFGQYAEALQSYNRSLELDPSFGLAWYGKGVTLRNMQRFDESDACFEYARQHGIKRP
jgi:tetratricopeptide (TPR) repeat protein